MRYLAVCTCFLVVLSSCTLDDGDEPNSASAFATTGQDLVVDNGLARVVIPAASIGGTAGQLPAGSKVELRVVEANVAGHRKYSPVVEVRALTPAGTAVTGLNMNPPASFEMSYDSSLANSEGKGPEQLAMLKLDGTTTRQLVFSATTPATNDEWTSASTTRAQANVSSFSRFLMADRKSTTTPPPAAVTLTGSISTVSTFTILQLANTGNTITVNLAIPTTDTATPPTLLTLNDASYNAANPIAPTNRIITVTQGGVTYTSDAAAASVAVQINTFTGTSSAGTITGTVVQQAGSATVSINFTWTTGGAAAEALGGTATDLLGRRTITLTNAAQSAQIVMLMPDTLPNGTLDPITFNDASFDISTPLDPSGRILTVVEAGTTYSSDVPVVGSVTVTFTAFNPTTRVGTGTITGTVVSATPSTKSLNYTFSTTGGATGGGTGTFAAEPPADISTTSTAVESALTHDGVDFIGVWLSAPGVTNRVLEIVEIDDSDMSVLFQQDFEPGANLDPAAGLSAAVSDTFMLMVAGANGTDAGTSQAHAVLYDYLGSSGVNIVLGAGTRPLVAFDLASGSFVVAWQQGADVMVQCFDDTGAAVSAAVTAITGATLRGLASPDGATDEALVTAEDGSGVVGRFITPSTGATAGAAFDLSTSEGGGVCAWDSAAAQYLVITETQVLGFFTLQVVKALAAGSSTPLANTLTLAALTGITSAAGGSNGVVFSDANTNLYAVRGGVSGPALAGNPIFGSVTGLATDTTANGPALGAAAGGVYAALSAKGADGIEAVRLTVTP